MERSGVESQLFLAMRECWDYPAYALLLLRLAFNVGFGSEADNAHKKPLRPFRSAGVWLATT